MDYYLKYTGPVETIDVIIPEKLKSMITYENSSTKKRIEILKPSADDPDITIVIPSAQITKIVQSDGIYLMFRSNEFETEIKEIYNGVNYQYVYYIQEPCDDISFDSTNGKGAIHLSCQKSSDVVIYTEKLGAQNNRVKNMNVRYMSPSINSSITHIEGGVAVIARTVKSSDSEVTIQVDKVKANSPAPSGNAKKYLSPISTATI